jgi:hypothetical protein
VPDCAAGKGYSNVIILTEAAKRRFLKISAARSSDGQVLYL